MIEIKKITPHFSNVEFACKGCLNAGQIYMNINPLLIYILEDIRNFVSNLYHEEKPIVISSGCRCESHNRMQGGTPLSYHITGNAVDIYCPKLNLSEFYRAIEKSGKLTKIRGLGFYPSQNFLHFDIGNRYARWICTYIEDKKVYTNLLQL